MYTPKALSRLTRRWQRAAERLAHPLCLQVSLFVLFGGHLFSERRRRRHQQQQQPQQQQQTLKLKLERSHQIEVRRSAILRQILAELRFIQPKQTCLARKAVGINSATTPSARLGARYASDSDLRRRDFACFCLSAIKRPSKKVNC